MHNLTDYATKSNPFIENASFESQITRMTRKNADFRDFATRFCTKIFHASKRCESFTVNWLHKSPKSFSFSVMSSSATALRDVRLVRVVSSI